MFAENVTEASKSDKPLFWKNRIAKESADHGMEPKAPCKAMYLKVGILKYLAHFRNSLAIDAGAGLSFDLPGSFMQAARRTAIMKLAIATTPNATRQPCKPQMIMFEIDAVKMEETRRPKLIANWNLM